jgi:hypothetical protein
MIDNGYQYFILEITLINRDVADKVSIAITIQEGIVLPKR